MKYVRILALTAGISLLSFHFASVGLSLMPDNPIKHQLKYELYAYMEPYFSQTWNLFSPNPVNTNMTVLFQFRLHSGGAADTSAWVDIYQPLIEEKRAHFWSPVQRLSKFMTSSMQNVLESNTRFAKAIKEDSVLLSSPALVRAAYRQHLAMCFGHTSLVQYSNYVLGRMYDPSVLQRTDSVFVRYEIFDAKFPRFSKREADYFDLKNYKFTKSTSDYFKL